VIGLFFQLPPIALAKDLKKGVGLTLDIFVKYLVYLMNFRQWTIPNITTI
jgi:hypothetical protein